MLPSSWRTARLIVQDVVASDLELVLECLAESSDVAHLDPAFALAPRSELEALIARSLEQVDPADRKFQMQILRLAGSGEVAGYWHFMAVPSRESAVGVSIMLVRPAHRRAGLGSELIASAVTGFHPSKLEIWARVYLGNLPAIEFWSQLGFLTLARLADTYVLPPSDKPSIIVSRPCSP